MPVETEFSFYMYRVIEKRDSAVAVWISLILCDERDEAGMDEFESLKHDHSRTGSPAIEKAALVVERESRISLAQDHPTRDKESAGSRASTRDRDS